MYGMFRYLYLFSHFPLRFPMYSQYFNLETREEKGKWSLLVSVYIPPPKTSPSMAIHFSHPALHPPKMRSSIIVFSFEVGVEIID